MTTGSSVLETVIADLSDESVAASWRAVNDDVMGGISRGGPAVERGRLVFSGETRLENNGGFSSIRSSAGPWDLEGARELRLRVRGTSTREYRMILQTGATTWGRPISYWLTFTLEGDGWQTVRLPLDGFAPNFRGRKLAGPPLDTSDIRTLGVMVYDKKAGPFRLELEWIKAAWTDVDAR